MRKLCAFGLIWFKKNYFKYNFIFCMSVIAYVSRFHNNNEKRAINFPLKSVWTYFYFTLHKDTSCPEWPSIYKLKIVQCTLRTAQCTLYTKKTAIYTEKFILQTVLYTVSYTLNYNKLTTANFTFLYIYTLHIACSTIFSCTLNPSHFLLLTDCTQTTVQYALLIVHCTLKIVHGNYKLNTVHVMLFTVQCRLHTVHVTLYTAHVHYTVTTLVFELALISPDWPVTISSLTNGVTRQSRPKISIHHAWYQESLWYLWNKASKSGSPLIHAE